MPRMGEHDIAGYIKCACGVLVVESFALQTGRRCADCWTGAAHPLYGLEVVHRGARTTIRTSSNKEKARDRRTVSRGDPDTRRKARSARDAAWARLQLLFPDLYAMLYDEERARRGLPPVARYTPVEFDKTASETLQFDAVYDALHTSGVTDGP
jgi:hypothetical protein